MSLAIIRGTGTYVDGKVYEFKTDTASLKPLEGAFTMDLQATDEVETLGDGREAVVWRPVNKTGWKTITVLCRICKHRHVSVYPADIVDEEHQECPDCHNMTCGPEEGQE